MRQSLCPHPLTCRNDQIHASGPLRPEIILVWDGAARRFGLGLGYRRASVGRVDFSTNSMVIFAATLSRNPRILLNFTFSKISWKPIRAVTSQIPSIVLA